MHQASVEDARIIEPQGLKDSGNGAYYSPQSLPIVGGNVIEFLKEAARSNALRRARFCAHPSPDAEQHDMVIVSHRDTYVTPHRHLTKSESFLVLEGLASLILFDDHGIVTKVVKMGSLASGRPFFYRMPPGCFHALSIETELLVFVESTKGPFTLEDREHAAWAPHPNDSAAGKAYIESITRTIRPGA